MITADEIRDLIKRGLPDADVYLEDLTGGADHWRAVVVSEAFAGQSRIARHQMVYRPLGDAMVSRIHALQLTTLTPPEAREQGLGQPPTQE